MRSVLYLSPFVPAEWIAAHGFRPRRIVAPASGRAAPAGACPWFEDAREALDARARREDAAGVVVTTTCDQARRGAEELEAAFLLNVPHTTKPAAHRLYRDELRRLGRWLVERGGREPELEGLAETVRAYDDSRRALREARGRMSGRAWAEAVVAYLDDGRPRFAPAAEAPPARRGVPVALVGGPLWEPRRLHELVEAAGGEVVLDGTETGERGLPAPMDRRRRADDPLGEIVDAHFGGIPDAFRRPNADLYRWLGERLEVRGARGLILVRCVWCDLWHAEVARLREWCRRPLADVDLTGEEGALARARTRIDALVDAAR